MGTSSIIATKGSSFLLKVTDPDTSPASHIAVGGLRNVRMTLNGNPVDISNMDGSNNREWLPTGGIKEMSIEADGVVPLMTPSTGLDFVQEAILDQLLLYAQIISGHADLFEIQAVINSFERSGAFDGPELFTISLTSHGAIAYTAVV